MNERNLSRRLATSVVDTLKSRGHILVVKGGAQALARELDELMAPSLMRIAPRLEPRVVLVGEVTSTFGNEMIDEAVEELVAKMTRALMDSDHVEDVFAEDNVIRRDIFRTVRDGLLRPPEQEVEVEADEEGEPQVQVRLETLGYVAATVSKRADAKTMRDALTRAGELVDAEFLGYVAESREASFLLDGAGPDARLDLEEAVADELSALVEQGFVELPTIERRADVGREVSPSEQIVFRPRIEGIASKTLHRSGCAANWEFVDGRTLKIVFTPLSEQDARDVDQPVALFARGVAALLATAPSSSPELLPMPERPVSSKRPAVAVAKVEHPEPAFVDDEEEEEEAEEAELDSEPPPEKPKARRVVQAAPSSRRRAGEAPRPAAKRAAKRPATKRAAATTTATSAATSAKKKAAAPKRAAAPAPAKARKTPAKKR